MRALLSVYDKTGLTGFARGLSELGVELIASGGTARELADASIDHIEVGDVTGVPEMLSGRVKTLHPGIHGGILADLDDPSHRRDLEAHAIEPIGLVVCNLYPFDARPSVEMIDIGGPAMVRAAAKNHARVAVVVDPAEYEPVLAALRQNGEIDARYRARLARAAFALTASYDAAVTRWLEAREVVLGGGLEEGSPASTSSLPSNLNLSLDRCQQLRYGENPHQKGAFYRLRGAGQGWLEGATRHGGRELSYLNLFDADAAWRLCAEVAELADPVLRRLRAGLSPTRAAAVVVKHANPCGVALGRDGLTAYELAVEADRTSAFGGTVALSVPVDAVLADLIAAGPLADVLVAPGFSPDAVQVFGSKRKNMRVLAAPAPFEQALSLRGVDGGFLVQETDRLVAGRETWRIVTAAEPSPSQWADLQL
ncbi:MAG: bifunctional phosphoribosylaminoimidazolecarboxamide formyltransferase/IMP cyclohydrolase, partial [Acidimicrobiales bacterium]